MRVRAQVELHGKGDPDENFMSKSPSNPRGGIVLAPVANCNISPIPVSALSPAMYKYKA